MRTAVFAVLAIVAPLLVASAALAQAPPGDLGGDIALGLEALQAILAAVTSAPAVGGLAAAAAVVAALVGLTKLRALRVLLDARGLAWLRPIIAAVLGALGAGLTAASTGQGVAGVITAALGGLLAGLAGVGTHELVRTTSPIERARVRVDELALTVSAQALEEQIGRTARLPAVQARVAEAATLPPAKRVEALAELLRRAP
jgi:hypothetical protein